MARNTELPSDDIRIRHDETGDVPGSNRAKLTVVLPQDLLEEMRDAAYWLSGPPHHLTLASIAKRAIIGELERIRQRHNHGEKFEARRRSLRVGRPVTPR